VQRLRVHLYLARGADDYRKAGHECPGTGELPRRVEACASVLREHRHQAPCLDELVESLAGDAQPSLDKRCRQALCHEAGTIFEDAGDVARARLGQRPLRSLGIFPLAGGRGRIRRQVCEFIPGTLQCSERLLHNELRKGVEKFMAARTLLWRKGG